MSSIHLKDRSVIPLADDKYDAVEEAYMLYVNEKQDTAIKLPNQTIKSSEIRKIERSDGYRKHNDVSYTFDEAQDMVKGYLKDGKLSFDDEKKFLEDQMVITTRPPYSKDNFAVSDPSGYKRLTDMLDMWKTISSRDTVLSKRTGVVSKELAEQLKM